jgi:hypothetical protein
LSAEIHKHLTREFLAKNREGDIGSPSQNWRALPWRQVVHLEAAGKWELEDCPYHMKEIWDIFSERRERYETVYVPIN